MPHILLLLPTATYRAEAFLEAARRLNISVTIGCEQAGRWENVPSIGVLLLDFQNFKESQDRVERLMKAQPLDGIIGVEDTTTFIAASLAFVLGLPHHSPKAASAARNKLEMRTLLQTSKIRIPHFEAYSIHEDPKQIANHIQYPCVVKPLILSASCGVIRADDPESFCQAFTRVKSLLIQLGLTQKEKAAQTLLVEDFVPGTEVAVEGILTKGTLQVLALFDKPDPLDGPFFEETIYITPSRLPSEIQDQITDTLQGAAHALGLAEGPVHGELRINTSGVWVIELAGRSIGGRCSQILQFGSGMTLEELILRHTLRLEIPTFEREKQAAGVMMLPIKEQGYFQALHGQTEARNTSGITLLEVTARSGDLLVPLPEGTRYLGFLLAKGPSPDHVERSLRKAYGYLVVETTPFLDESPDMGVIRV
ncbi:MAG: ATP-grasp domain-containing protein [Nitrospirota bacterium]|nr:MAG: ATP-grasp domain-containing protein [Nitrospirota bacterium]